MSHSYVCGKMVDGRDQIIWNPVSCCYILTSHRLSKELACCAFFIAKFHIALCLYLYLACWHILGGILLLFSLYGFHSVVCLRLFASIMSHFNTLFVLINQTEKLFNCLSFYLVVEGVALDCSECKWTYSSTYKVLQSKTLPSPAVLANNLYIVVCLQLRF